MSFQERTAIVTGGTGVLGRVLVRDFFEAGVRIAVPLQDMKGLNSLPPSLRGAEDRLFTARADLTSESDVKEFVDRAIDKFGSVEYLLNLAGGYAGGKMIDEVSVEEWDGQMKMNLHTAFLMCRAVLPHMRKHEFGRIVSVAAMPAMNPGARKGPYQISKRAVITLTETIAEETKSSGITANAIAPSILVTEANKKSMPDADYSTWVTPEEISRLVLYLCSDEAKSVSGNVIKIFGGV